MKKSHLLFFLFSGIIGNSGFINPVFAEWPSDPSVNVPIVTSPGEQSHPSITTDGHGGAIIAWQDFRNTTNFDIYAQRIDSSGNVRWAANGVVICNAPDMQQSPKAIADGNGGAYIVWSDARNAATKDTDLYAQHVDNNGNIQWAANGIPIVLRSQQTNFAIVPPAFTATTDDNGGIFVAWEDDRECYRDSIYKVIIRRKITYDTVCAMAPTSISVPRIFMQHLNQNGIVWDTNGVLSSDTLHAYSQNFAQLVSDETGGVYLVWNELHGSTDQIFCQHFSANATKLFPIAGQAVCTQGLGKSDLTAVKDNHGGFIAAWEDNRNSLRTGTDIYVQRINPSGAMVWNPAGDTVCVYDGNFDANQISPVIVADTGGGAYIVWEDARTITNGYDLYAQHLKPNGFPLWQAGGVVVVAAQQDQNQQRLSLDDSGGVYAAWVDYRSSTGDIYAKRIAFDGKTIWDTAPICDAPNNQDQLTMVMAGGAVICAWHDQRKTNDNGDIYAQAFAANGILPVEIESLTATPDVATGAVTLAWKTVSEINTAGFEILRSDGNGSFVSIAGYPNDPDLAAEGKATGTHQYFYTDRSGHTGIVEYKLVAIDNDGSRQEFGPVSVTISAPRTFTLSQNYPNPFGAVSQVEYSLPRQADVTITLSDLLGRELKRFEIPGEAAGVHIQNLDANGLIPGAYILALRAGMWQGNEHIMIVK